MINTISVQSKVLLVSLGIFCFLGSFGVIHNVNAEENEENTQEEIAEELKIEENAKKGVPNSGIQISPTKFVWTLKEGETKTERINVKNYSNIEQYVTVEVEDFFVGEDGMEPKFFVPDEEHPLKSRDVIDWIKVPDEFVLAPDEAKWVDFVIDVPEDQPTNGYYGGILFKTGGKPEGEGSKIGISYRVGSLVIMAVQGDEPMKLDAKLLEFYSKKGIYWESPAEVVAKVENTGNIHFPMYGKVEYKKNGKDFHITELPPQLLYPDISREYTERMMFGIWDFGKFSAKFTVKSDSEAIDLEDEVTFWVIPWKGLAIIFGGFILFMIFIKLFKKYVHIGKKPSNEKTSKKQTPQKQKVKKQSPEQSKKSQQQNQPPPQRPRV